MILVCVGASEYNFDRLLRIMDDLCEDGSLSGENIIAQIGQTEYRPKHYRYFALIGRDDFQKILENADLIITHAGTGSIIPPLKLGKKVIIFPRLEKYREHLDDHQLEIRDAFVEEGYALGAETKDELLDAINASVSFEPKKFRSNNSRMNGLIIDYIEHLQ